MTRLTSFREKMRWEKICSVDNFYCLPNKLHAPIWQQNNIPHLSQVSADSWCVPDASYIRLMSCTCDVISCLSTYGATPHDALMILLPSGNRGMILITELPSWWRIVSSDVHEHGGPLGKSFDRSESTIISHISCHVYTLLLIDVLTVCWHRLCSVHDHQQTLNLCSTANRWWR